MPGSGATSWGYSGYGAMKYGGKVSFALPRFGKGDVVGFCIDTASGTAFVTQNGQRRRGKWHRQPAPASLYLLGTDFLQQKFQNRK